MLGGGGATALAGCLGDDGTGGADGEVPIDHDETPEELPAVSGSYDTNTPASFETLNPIYNTESGAGTAIGRALDQGYTFDANDELVPLLYDLWTDDNEVWVFELRDTLEFSDPYGQVTAEDFVYLIQELHQADWAATANAVDWAGVTVVQTGDLEFQAELPSPAPLYPESFDPLEYPIPQALLEPYVEDEDLEGLQQNDELLELTFTGNLGPYVLESWDRGSGTTYSRNDDYYLQEHADELSPWFENAPYFEEASIDVVEEQSSRLGQLETGEVDATGIPPERFAEFDEDPTVRVLEILQPFNQIMAMNMRDNGWNAGPGNLFRIVEFRQAISAAIDREEIIEGVYRGTAEEHHTWQPAWSEWYPGEDAITKFGVGDRYGEAVARDLASDAFAQSAYDYRFDGDDLVTPDGDQVVLELYHSSGQETEQLYAEVIADELEANLGIEVEVEPIDGVRFAQDFWTADPVGGTDEVRGEEVSWDGIANPNNPGPRDVTSDEAWDLSVVLGLNTYPRNPLTNQAFFDGANARYNPTGWYPEFDAAGLMEEALTATTEAEIADAMTELFVRISETQPYVMLVFGPDITGYNPDLRGPTTAFSNGWDLAAWHLEE